MIPAERRVLNAEALTGHHGACSTNGTRFTSTAYALIHKEGFAIQKMAALLDHDSQQRTDDTDTPAAERGGADLDAGRLRSPDTAEQTERKPPRSGPRALPARGGAS